jgi:CheY-like chemotaxis protein
MLKPRSAGLLSGVRGAYQPPSPRLSRPRHGPRTLAGVFRLACCHRATDTSFRIMCILVSAGWGAGAILSRVAEGAGSLDYALECTCRVVIALNAPSRCHIPKLPTLALTEAPMLDGARILVAEDEALIGIDLADHLEGFGAKVIGPVASVSDAILLIERNGLHAALLDFQLNDGETTPLLTMLAARRVPTVVYTGRREIPDLSGTHPDVTVLQKPLPMHVLVAELFESCRGAQARPAPSPSALQTAAHSVARLSLDAIRTSRRSLDEQVHEGDERRLRS